MASRPQPPASLAATLFLLAYDPDRGRLGRTEELRYLLRGAALIDLSQRGCVADRDGRVRASGTRRTGDPLLDALLREIAEANPKPWRHWIRRGGGTVGAVRDQLADAGTIRVTTTRVLGIFPVRRITVPDPTLVPGLRDRVSNALRGNESPHSVDPTSATLVALAAAGPLRGVVSRRDRRTYADRIAAFEQHGGAAVPAVRAVLRQVRSARAAAASAGG